MFKRKNCEGELALTDIKMLHQPVEKIIIFSIYWDWYRTNSWIKRQNKPRT